MRILVIGSGGREHALCWKLKQSTQVEKIFCAPGNPGIESVAECVKISSTNYDELIRFARSNKIDLTVVGPEIPLVDGIVEKFSQNGLFIFGPSSRAAILEGSKIFSKNFMLRNNIPTANFATFNSSQKTEAENYIAKQSFPLVIKADGLAFGKGVVICQDYSEAIVHLKEFFENNIFGQSGANIVIEEFMEGEEASLFVLTDGENFATLLSAQDHKNIFDGDKGKNTGGMGAYCPAPIVTDEILNFAINKIVEPTLRGMKNEGRIYRGCLYVGLMITNEGAKVVEYNCRFGDPEAQVVLPLIDEDLAEIFLSCARGTFKNTNIKFHIASAVCVVVASQGYPDNYEKGKEITGLENIKNEEGIVVFHAGTKKENDKIYSDGGRVLGVTAISFKNDLRGAIDKSYSAIKKIHFDGMYYRSDIGFKGVK